MLDPGLRKKLSHIVRPLLDAVRDLAPIVAVISFFQLLVLQQPFPNLTELFSGFILIIFGLALFVRGLDMALFPWGEGLAHAFARKGNVLLLLSFSFLLGFGTTIAEPALIAIANKAAQIAAQGGMIESHDEAMQNYASGLRYTVAFSVGCAILLGVLRILLGWPLHWCIMVGYLLVIAMTAIAPKEIIGIAYDSGGVTTSTITVPLVTALGVGLAASLSGRNPLLDGFGLIAFASLLPVIFVMLYGLWIV